MSSKWGRCGSVVEDVRGWAGRAAQQRAGELDAMGLAPKSVGRHAEL